MNCFCRLELRTHDVPSARAFYSDLLGDEALEIIDLPAQAAARGAPAHWLGYIGVADVSQQAEAFIARGATRLGPMQRRRDGGHAVVMRDGTGVIVGLSSPPQGDASRQPVWQELYTPDSQRASSSYCEMFGWELQATSTSDASSVYPSFAWESGAGSAGSIIDIANLAGVHAHWLFYFGVPDLELAIQRVRNVGGTVKGPLEHTDGTRFAICEDGQRAAFGLREAPAG